MSRRNAVAILLAMSIASPAIAESVLRVTGPLVFTHDDGGYVGVAGDDLLEAHALSPWPESSLAALLAKPELTYVTLPADGFEGPVIDRQGRCLSNDELASSPSWLPCSSRFSGQTWRHASGEIISVDAKPGRGGRLGFWPGMSSRGTLTIEGGDISMRLLTSVLTPHLPN